ncbi:Vps71/ZNHIT1 [Gracilaria domingensis]|nr:Vps71/ZNHIT1 [Gracilaria domingensis]
MTSLKSGSSKLEETTTRGKRKREVANRVKHVDFSVIQQARNRRLEALENDNYAAEQEAILLEGEDEYEPGMESEEEMAGKKKSTRTRKRKQRRRQRGLKDNRAEAKGAGIERWNKSTHAAFEEENLSARPNKMVTWEQMIVPPSSRPPRYFCSTCGSSRNQVPEVYRLERCEHDVLALSVCFLVIA